MTTYCLKGGTLVDPANGIDQQHADLWIRDGVLIEPPETPPADTVTRDLTGYIVMPGGIDMHCHIAGPKVNHARSFVSSGAGRGTRKQSQSAPLVPGTIATGRLFAGLGYTTAVDAAIPGLSARLAHHELAHTPVVDKAFLALFGNHHYILEQIGSQNQDAVQEYVSWMLGAVHAYGVKIVNPGGVENWKQISRKTLRELDEKVGEFGVSPRSILQSLAAAVDNLGLPHPLHIHCNNLGFPGNWETTLHTMKSLEGRRGHFAHIQFHSYGGNPDDPTSFCSQVQPLVDYVCEHPEISVDVGHVLPGEAMTITGDAPFADHLRRLTGGRWFSSDTELESSCGVIPSRFKPYKNLVHATQWAIGLEWYLRMPDPWRIAMSSDHPNGGAFVRYPEMIHLLMDRAFREEMISKMPEQLVEKSTLQEIDREYTLSEIATITRAAPARLLGMKDRGHLGAGAVADITVYAPDENRTEMFARPRWVYKAGQEMVTDGELSNSFIGNLLTAEIETTSEFESDRREWFNDNYSISYGNYRIHEEDSPCLAR